MTQRVLTIAAMALLFSGICIVENSAIRARPEEPALSRDSSVYALAGEFRTVFANLLWVKAEQYHHEYTQRDRNWARDKELMSLLDMITALDPHFIEAYGVGAYILMEGYNDPSRTMRYLDRAIACNPKAWELHHIKAVMLVRRMHDPKAALPHALAALHYCDDEFYQRREIRLIHTLRTMIRENTRKGAPDTSSGAPK